MNPQIYYLNNSGSRWVLRPNESQYIKRHPSNEIITRKPRYFEAFGNFAACVYNYKGKIESSLRFTANKERIPEL